MDAQYFRAMQALRNAAIADVSSLYVFCTLQSLHRIPTRSVQPLSRTALCTAPWLTKPQVLRTARPLDLSFAAGFERMSLRHLCLFAFEIHQLTGESSGPECQYLYYVPPCAGRYSSILSPTLE